MQPIKRQYGPYIEEECCEDCGYAGGYDLMGNGRPVQICPDCGGKLVTVVGRWAYTEAFKWYYVFTNYGCNKTTYHGFLKGRGNLGIEPPPPHPDNNYTLEGSLAAYNAAHPPRKL